MVEGGRIDHAHHAGNAYRALTDAVEFAARCRCAMDMTDASDTLILVTADHSHTFTMSGYPGAAIRFSARSTRARRAGERRRGKPYTTLGYANGPGFREALPDLTRSRYRSAELSAGRTVPDGGGDPRRGRRGRLCAGPNADTLRGVMEQNALSSHARALFDGAELRRCLALT